MTNFTKCMLASDADLSTIRYPLLASPKIDGIRCRIWENKPMSRSWKLIRNRYVQEVLSFTALNGLDGELAVGEPFHPNLMQATTSGVMSADGVPNFTFWIFDIFSRPDTPFTDRYQMLNDYFTSHRSVLPQQVQLLPQQFIQTPEELAQFEMGCVNQGYEGIITRDPSSLYKNGRSTAREQGMLKVKRFIDSEAVVIDVQEFMHNANEATINALGHTERSSHKDNKVPMGMLGALVCNDIHTNQPIKIGTGFDHATRQSLWNVRDSLRNRVVKYKYFNHGIKDAPRHPVFLGFRDQDDL